MMRHQILSYRTYKTIWPPTATALHSLRNIGRSHTSAAAVSFQLRVKAAHSSGRLYSKTMSHSNANAEARARAQASSQVKHWRQLQAAWVNALATPVLSGSEVASVTF